MSENISAPRSRPRRPRLALVGIALTALACVAALVCRTPLRARYWAWRLETAPTPASRALYLGALCNAADQGRWGIEALLGHADASVRQYGVLALQHVKTEWARRRLLDALADPDVTVRRLAAVGLAIHGDESVIPALKWLYQVGDPSSATAACLALERLGTSAAIAALDELTLEPADVGHRAALIDALAGIGTTACGPALLRLLTDQRVCDLPPRSEEAAQRALQGMEAAGYPVGPASWPTTGARPHTVAERAAAVLAQITGLPEPFSSEGAEEQRAAAIRQWTEWLAGHGR